MAVVFLILGYLSIPVLIVSVGFTIRSIRRERQVTITRRSLVIPMVIVGVIVLTYITLLDVTAGATTTWLPLAGGAAVGLWWCHATTHLTLEGGRVLGAKTVWVLVPWVISMALTQGLALAESGLTVSLGFPVMFAASGLTLGEHAGLFRLRSSLLTGRTPPPAPAAATVALLIGFIVVGLPGIAAAETYGFEQIANGEEPSVRVEQIIGSGQGYYGDSVSVFIRNDTGHTITVEVATGVRLVPRDAGVQEMVTVGQTFEVPPGGSTHLIKAFCGEMHDRAPGGADIFDVRGKVEEPLERALTQIRRDGMGDSRDAQDYVWHLRDGQDISGNQVAQDLMDASRRTPLRRDAEESGAAIALIGGCAAAGLTGTDRRRLLLGPHALKQLTLRGARTRTIAVVDPKTGEVKDKVFVLPPGAPPSDSEAMAFTTKTITDPSTGESFLVIDDEQEVQLLQKPLVPRRVPEPIGDGAAGTDGAGGTDKPEPPKAPKQIDDDEAKRIVEWGVEHNRPPDEIQRDLDARNESLGGSGIVPMPQNLKRITLPQGEITLTAAEYEEYLRRATHLEHVLSNAKIYRDLMQDWAKKAQFWSGADRLVVYRWIAATKQVYDMGLRMNQPELYLARKGGFSGVEHMLEHKYGKPTWTSYDTRHHASLEHAIQAWKQEQGGGWSRLQGDRSRTITEARESLRTMVPKTAPTGEAPTLPERVFVGPTVDAPKRLWPSEWGPSVEPYTGKVIQPKAGPPVSKLSWLNRPVRELQDVMKLQQQGIEYMRGARLEMQGFLEYEADLAQRIKPLGD
jgi:hypothetical protein